MTNYNGSIIPPEPGSATEKLIRDWFPGCTVVTVRFNSGTIDRSVFTTRESAGAYAATITDAMSVSILCPPTPQEPQNDTL